MASNAPTLTAALPLALPLCSCSVHYTAAIEYSPERATGGFKVGGGTAGRVTVYTTHYMFMHICPADLHVQQPTQPGTASVAVTSAACVLAAMFVFENSTACLHSRHAV